MWRCTKCETMNEGEFCMICGYSRADALAAAAAAPVEPAAPAGGYGWNFQSADSTPDLEPNYNPHTGRVEPTYNPAAYGARPAEPKAPYVNPYIPRDDLPPTYAPHAPAYPGYPTYPVKKSMSGKMVTALIMFIVAAIAFFFLPVMDMMWWGELVVGENIEELFENMFDNIAFTGMILTLISCIVGLIGACCKSKSGAITGAILGIVGLVLIIVYFMDLGADLDEVFELLLPGFYVPLICFVTAWIAAGTDN